MSHFWCPSCTPSCNVQLAWIPVSIACYSLLRRHAIKCPPTSSICPQCHVYNQLSVHKSSDWLEILKTVFGLNIAGNFAICCSYGSIQGVCGELRETFAFVIHDWNMFFCSFHRPSALTRSSPPSSRTRSVFWLPKVARRSRKSSPATTKASGWASKPQER